jgi:putative phosphoribosyl transferase
MHAECLAIWGLMTLHMPPVTEESVRIPLLHGHALDALLAMPTGASPVIVLADGDRSSLHSRPFRGLAKNLNDAGIGTLLLDLLTSEEATEVDAAAKMRTNIATLAGRFGAAARYLRRRCGEPQLAIGYCASAVASAAALSSSLAHSLDIRAIVCLEGFPDLARRELEEVSAATLLVAAGNHFAALESNRAAFASLNCQKKLAVVSGAGRLLDEEGALSAAMDVTRRWFERRLRRSAP